MLKKIITGGQTEADRAVLDIAIKLRIPHGGWIPKGRITEAGPLPAHYKLQENETENYSECIKKNVMDSAGTLIISYGSLAGDLDHARKSALRYGRQMLGIDFNQIDDAKAASLLNDWIRLYRIDVLHVIGPGAGVNPYVRNQTENMLEGALTMGFLTK
jgi:hypothetical protein